jgi:hypothetical protein
MIVSGGRVGLDLPSVELILTPTLDPVLEDVLLAAPAVSQDAIQLGSVEVGDGEQVDLSAVIDTRSAILRTRPRPGLMRESATPISASNQPNHSKQGWSVTIISISSIFVTSLLCPSSSHSTVVSSVRGRVCRCRELSHRQ